jgi:elongation factor P
MIETNGFKKGVCIVYKGAPVIIADMSVSTPTARGGNTIYKTKFRNLVSGQILNESIRSGEKFEEVDMERHNSSYLYNDGTNWYFMDDETFEQFEFAGETLGDATGYIIDGIVGVQAMVIDGHAVSIELPMVVTLTVTETEPAIKGATAQAQLKPATTDTGLVVQVPAYIVADERIRVDTRDGHFVERDKS